MNVYERQFKEKLLLLLFWLKTNRKPLLFYINGRKFNSSEVNRNIQPMEEISKNLKTWFFVKRIEK